MHMKNSRPLYLGSTIVWTIQFPNRCRVRGLIAYNKPINMKNSVHSCTVKSESVCQILALHNLELATATSLEVYN